MDNKKAIRHYLMLGTLCSPTMSPQVNDPGRRPPKRGICTTKHWYHQARPMGDELAEAPQDVVNVARYSCFLFDLTRSWYEIHSKPDRGITFIGRHL